MKQQLATENSVDEIRTQSRSLFMCHTSPISSNSYNLTVVDIESINTQSTSFSSMMNMPSTATTSSAKSLILPLVLVGTILAVLRIDGGKPSTAPASGSFGGHIENDQGLGNIVNHLRKLDRSTVALKLSRALSTGSGYFYAQYYSKSNCSSGSGLVSYVEGYATGSCLQNSDSGSMIQTCSGSGIMSTNPGYEAFVSN